MCLVNACASVPRVGPVSQERAWKSYLGSERRAPPTGDTVNPDPQPVWRADLGRGTIGAPALAEEIVAIAQVDRQLALLDRATGELIWRRRFPSHLGAGPLLDFDRVYAATQDPGGRVYALELRSGRTVWSTPAGEVSAPLALEDTVLCAAGTDGWVALLSTARGQRLWRTQLPGAIRAAPVLTSAGVLVATTADSLFLLDRASGAVRSRRGTSGAVIAAPAAADSVVLIGTTSGRLEAVNQSTLVASWTLDLRSGIVGTVALHGAQAYVLTERGVLWRVPFARPQDARSVPTEMVTRAGPAPTATGTFVSGVTGEVALVDPDTGARRWSVRLKAPVNEPVLVDGRFILAVSARGEVVAFR